MQRFNDTFHEEIIVRANKGMANILFVLFTIFMVIFAIGSVMFLQGVLGMLTGAGFDVVTLINFLAFTGLAVLLYFVRNDIKVDYEYSFTNGVFDVAKVKNNKIRKELISFNIKDLEIMAPIMTNGFERHQGTDGIKKINAWLNRGNVKYFMISRVDGQKTMLIIEPSEKMVATIKKFVPTIVKTK